MQKKTKIIATVGPASDSRDRIEGLILEGVDVFRFNTKYADIEWHNERIKRVREVLEKMGKKIGIMIDLRGAELRIETRNKKNLKIKKGDKLIIGNSFCYDNISLVISEESIFKKIKIGDRILIDGGLIELRVSERQNNLLSVSVVEGGIVKDRKSVNFPGIKIKLSSLIEKDIENLDAAVKNNVSFIALSFVTSKSDVISLKKEMKKRKIKAAIVSKIENQAAIDNIDEIIEVSDAIMIARGDLGVEIPIERLAYWQKEIIQKCREQRKPVIVATQMLYSMIKNSIPTRAEATDTANAVFDGTDAVMLSEETAIGRNPIKAVHEMAKIMFFNEGKAKVIEIKGANFNPSEFVIGAVAQEIIRKAALENMGIKTAIAFSESGYTARILSSFRLRINIIVATNNVKTAEKLSLSYGITPLFTNAEFDSLKIPKEIIELLRSKKIISKNEMVAVFHGRDDKKPELLNLFSLTKIK